jgi:hypothetical protein
MRFCQARRGNREQGTGDGQQGERGTGDREQRTREPPVGARPASPGVTPGEDRQVRRGILPTRGRRPEMGEGLRVLGGATAEDTASKLHALLRRSGGDLGLLEDDDALAWRRGQTYCWAKAGSARTFLHKRTDFPPSGVYNDGALFTTDDAPHGAVAGLARPGVRTAAP